MSEDTEKSMETSLSAATGAGFRAGAHDQNTIFQQNNALQSEVMQSLVEVRRQTVAEFEQRMRQQDQQFQNTMQMVLQNAEAASARASANQQQAQVQNNTQSLDQAAKTAAESAITAANNTARHAMDMGVVTIIP